MRLDRRRIAARSEDHRYLSANQIHDQRRHTFEMLLGASMSQILGQQIVAENRAAAGTIIGAEFVAHADPDTATYAANKILNQKFRCAPTGTSVHQAA
jgi:hypothetical protein